MAVTVLSHRFRASFPGGALSCLGRSATPCRIRQAFRRMCLPLALAQTYALLPFHPLPRRLCMTSFDRFQAPRDADMEADMEKQREELAAIIRRNTSED